MTIVVEDLEINIELDKEAMTHLLGGKRNQASATTYSNSATPVKIRWANTRKPSTHHSPLYRSRTSLYKY